MALPAATGVPEAPAGLGEAGERLWQDAWRAGQAWLSPALDAGTVELACRTLDEIAGHREDVDRYGRIVEEPVLYLGQLTEVVRLKPNPALKSLRAAEQQLERWLSALAFTPTERARLGLAQVKAQSKLEALLELRARRDAG